MKNEAFEIIKKYQIRCLQQYFEIEHAYSKEELTAKTYVRFIFEKIETIDKVYSNSITPTWTNLHTSFMNSDDAKELEELALNCLCDVRDYKEELINKLYSYIELFFKTGTATGVVDYDTVTAVMPAED